MWLVVRFRVGHRVNPELFISLLHVGDAVGQKLQLQLTEGGGVHLEGANQAILPLLCEGLVSQGLILQLVQLEAYSLWLLTLVREGGGGRMMLGRKQLLWLQLLSGLSLG